VISNLRAELRKIVSTPLWWLLLICVGVLSVGSALVPARVSTGGSATGPVDPGTVRSVYHAGNTVARILAMVLGIAAVGAEYRYRTWTATYLASPRRLRVMAGKVVALLIVGLVYGVASVLAGVAVAAPYIHRRGGTLLLDRPETWRSLALGVCSVALWAVLGLGIGLLVGNLRLALLVGVGTAFVLESVVSVAFFLLHWDRGLDLLPSGATNSLLGVTAPVLLAAPHLFAWWQGGLVLAGWCLLPAALGVLSAVRRDVT
jgi:ABC-2 type transport system permease protein